MTTLERGNAVMYRGRHWAMVVDYTPNAAGMTDTLIDCLTHNHMGQAQAGRYWVASNELTPIPNNTTTVLRQFHCTRKGCFYHQLRGSWRDHAMTALGHCPNCGSEIVKD